MPHVCGTRTSIQVCFSVVVMIQVLFEEKADEIYIYSCRKNVIEKNADKKIYLVHLRPDVHRFGYIVWVIVHQCKF